MLLILAFACTDEVVETAEPVDTEAPPQFPCPEADLPDLDGSTWHRAGSAIGGDILSIIGESILGEGPLYALSTMNGMYRSDDGGRNWFTLLVQSTHGAGQMVQDSEGRVYVPMALGELMYSRDGTHFDRAGPEGIRGLTVHLGGVIAMDWDGQTWSGKETEWELLGGLPSPPPHGNEDNKFYPDASWYYLGSTGTRIFAAQHQGDLYVSNDHGVSFTVASSGPFEVTTFGVDGDRVHIWGENRGVVWSTDGGDNWSVTSTSVPLNGLGLWNDTLYAVGGESLYTVGDTLEEVYVWEDTVHEAFTVHGTTERLLVGHKDGIATTRDGTTWEASEGIETLDLGPLVTHPECPSRVYVGTQCERGLFSSIDYGGTLERVDEYLHYVMVPVVSASDPATMWVTSDDTLLRTDNLGGDWTYVLRDELTWHLHGLAVHPSDGDIVLVGTVGSGEAEDPNGMRVMRSTDGGENFVDSSEGLPVDSAASAHGITFVNDDVVLMGSFRGGDFVHTSSTPGVGLFRSADAGVTWTEVGPEGIGDAPVIAVCDSGVLAATDIGVLRSLDEGLTWSVVTTGDYLSVTCYDDVILAVDYDTIDRSDDGGDSWYGWGSGIDLFAPTRQMPQVAISADGEMAFAALPTGGLFRRPL
jgi:hypothetical protein